MTPEEIAQLQELLAASNTQSGQVTDDLENQLNQQISARDNENAALLGQLQNNFLTQQQAVSNIAPVTTGLANFVDAATGSNFTRSAEALANQRALIASGQDPVSQAFANQFAQEAELQQADNITPGQAVNAQVQLANQRRADQKASLQAELDIVKAQQQAERDQFDRDLKLRNAERQERLTQSQINRNNRPSTARANLNDPIRQRTSELRLEKLERDAEAAKRKEVEVPKNEREAIDDRSAIISNLRTTQSDVFNTEEGKLAFSLGARATENLPGTTEQFLPGEAGQAAIARANIKSKLNTQVQKVATILEGGKLAEGDIKRYRELLPSPNDSIELAATKMEDLIQTMIIDQQRAVETQRSRGKDTSIFDFGLQQNGITLSDPNPQTQQAAPVQQTNAQQTSAPQLDASVEAFLDAQGF